jgi:predicted CopG family antitoxin
VTGERQIWIEEGWANRLAALRQPGESYSDVILRLAKGVGRFGG